MTIYEVTASGVEAALEVASRGMEGLPWAISAGWATEIIEDYGLELAQSAGDMSGEASALFEYQGVTLRLKRAFPRKWQLYKGAWKRDARWTGD